MVDGFDELAFVRLSVAVAVMFFGDWVVVDCVDWWVLWVVLVGGWWLGVVVNYLPEKL